MENLVKYLKVLKYFDHSCKSIHGLKYDKYKKSVCMYQCLFIGVRFTSILGSKKYSAEKPTESRRSDRLSSQIPLLSLLWVSPKECNLCAKFRV